MLYIKRSHLKSLLGGWMGGWVGGWMAGKAGLRIAYSNQQISGNEIFGIEGQP
jgi:hypothetical protein